MTVSSVPQTNYGTFQETVTENAGTKQWQNYPAQASAEKNKMTGSDTMLCYAGERSQPLKKLNPSHLVSIQAHN